MENKIRNAFDNIKADSSLKETTKEFLSQKREEKEKKENEKKTDPMEYLRPDMDREDGEVGMFTLFSKIYDMMFVTTY